MGDMKVCRKIGSVGHQAQVRLLRPVQHRDRLRISALIVANQSTFERIVGNLTAVLPRKHHLGPVPGVRGETTGPATAVPELMLRGT